MTTISEQEPRRRVEIAPHYDLWMRGARFGELLETKSWKGETRYKVKLDKWKKPIWVKDLTFIR